MKRKEWTRLRRVSRERIKSGRNNRQHNGCSIRQYILTRNACDSITNSISFYASATSTRYRIIACHSPFNSRCSSRFFLSFFPLFYSDKISISDSLFSHRLGAGISCVFPKTVRRSLCEPVNYVLHCCGRQRALHSIRVCKLIKTLPQRQTAYAKFEQKIAIH